MSYGPQTQNPIEHDESPLDDETRFQCPCGDENCIGDNEDPANIRLGKAWYAADCRMVNSHPVVVEERERDQRISERTGK